MRCFAICANEMGMDTNRFSEIKRQLLSVGPSAGLSQTSIYRIIEGDIRVGDCFVESNYNNMTENCVVRMITNIDNNDLKYEYCENENNEPYIIGSSVNGISKDDIIEEVESGELLFVGTFDLGSK